MDQKKQQGQQNQEQPKQGQRSAAQQGGQQNWQQHPGSNPNRDQAEGSRDQNMTGDRHQSNPPRDMPEKGTGTPSERNRSSEDFSSNRSGGGISNRGADREKREQEELPDRGMSDSDRESER